jgi:hypothetical protein
MRLFLDHPMLSRKEIYDHFFNFNQVLDEYKQGAPPKDIASQ